MKQNENSTILVPKLPFGIVIESSNGASHISSDLLSQFQDEDLLEDSRPQVAADALESLLLAMASEGIDVHSDKMQRAITTAVESIANNAFEGNLAPDSVLEAESEQEFKLKEGITNCWVGVDNIDVYIKRTDEGVAVDLFAHGVTLPDPLGSTYAFATESDEEFAEDKQIDLDAVAEWVGLHYKVNFDAELPKKRRDWIDRFIESNHA
jgi:hypothetical protein